jgi:hypothetical protein
MRVLAPARLSCRNRSMEPVSWSVPLIHHFPGPYQHSWCVFQRHALIAVPLPGPLLSLARPPLGHALDSTLPGPGMTMHPYSLPTLQEGEKVYSCMLGRNSHSGAFRGQHTQFEGRNRQIAGGHAFHSHAIGPKRQMPGVWGQRPQDLYDLTEPRTARSDHFRGRLAFFQSRIEYGVTGIPHRNSQCRHIWRY